MASKPLILDFETKPIGLRPKDYPPEPVGFAWKSSGRRAYVSWGHASGRNTHTRKEAWPILKHLLSEASEVVCHNHGFDREVSQVHMGLGFDGQWHDTMFLAFLADPYGSMSLKPLAEKHLAMRPEERDAVREWLIANRHLAPNKKELGDLIWVAPPSVVGPYALGDVDRTERLWRLWQAHRESPAYARELELTPIVTEMEQVGVRLDMDLLRADVNRYFAILDKEDREIRKMIGREVDLDSDEEVARALEEMGRLRAPLPLTDKGKVSVAKRALIECVADRRLTGKMLMRNALATSLRTFMNPWLMGAVDGRLMFRFNQIRNEGGFGARTGRMSSSPNTMNIPSKWEMLYGILKDIGYKRTYNLPDVRRHILPDKGGKLVSVDFNQQEMRLFAHFEDGELMRAYQTNPKIDAHQMVADIGGITRKVAKTLNFAELYGAGLAVIMVWLDCTEQEARSFKAQYKSALPGVKDLKDDIEELVQRGEPIVTIGGREYHPEAPKVIQGRMRNFNYKLLNYLIQGSAADQTKQAMIDYHKSSARKGRLMFSVHDEVVISAPEGRVKEETDLLRECMAFSFKSSLDIPFLTDAKIGENYGEIAE